MFNYTSLNVTIWAENTGINTFLDFLYAWNKEYNKMYRKGCLRP